MPAWTWLEREGLLAPRPGDSSGLWYFVTPRGKQVRNREGVDAYRKSALLPHRQLHPMIAQRSWSAFTRGEYDTAVFQAFKELEVAIRKACGYASQVYGVVMARKAFDADSGPLTDNAAPNPEKEALANLMAGAIGSYKNPHSHRKIALTAEEAAEMVVLASHLLKVVDARKPPGDGNA